MCRIHPTRGGLLRPGSPVLFLLVALTAVGGSAVGREYGRNLPSAGRQAAGEDEKEPETVVFESGPNVQSRISQPNGPLVPDQAPPASATPAAGGKGSEAGATPQIGGKGGPESGVHPKPGEPAGFEKPLLKQLPGGGFVGAILDPHGFRQGLGHPDGDPIGGSGGPGG